MTPVHSLVALRDGGGGQPLFCFHPLPGTLVRFGPLIRNLGGRPVYGLQSRGLDLSRGPHEDLREMAADYAAEIRTAQPTGPYAFYGYSMGGLVAYETARQLAAAGEVVSLVALGDTDAVIDRAALREFVWPNLVRNILCLDEDPAVLMAMPARERIDRMADHAVNAEKRPFGSDRRIIRRMLEIYEVHIGLVAGYRVEAYPGKVVLLRSDEHSPLGDTLGWRPFAEDLAVHRVPGTHHGMMDAANAPVLAAVLARYLDPAVLFESTV